MKTPSVQASVVSSCVVAAAFLAGCASPQPIVTARQAQTLSSTDQTQAGYDTFGRRWGEAPSLAPKPAPLAEVEPAESGAIHNPLKGFRPDRGHKLYCPLWRVYVKWSDIEKCDADSPERLTSYLNNIAASAPASNVKLVPRVYLDWNGTRDRQYWPGDLRRFDYFSETFTARLTRLIRRMGVAWNKDPRIAFIQMGMIGFWGEMHNPAPTPAMMKLLIEEFRKAFPDTPVLVRTGDAPFMEAGFGIYYDTFANLEREPERYTKDPGPQVPTWALLKNYPRQWTRAPIEGEVEYSWQNSRASAKPDETFGRTPDETMKVDRYRNYMAGMFRRYHVSYMGWIAGFNDKDPDVLAGAGILNEVLGYRFVIPRFKWTPAPAGSLHVKFTVRNDGSAPFYRAWPVAVGLLDPATREVRWQADLKADVRTWLPGEDWDVGAGRWNVPPKDNDIDETIHLPDTIAKGNYIVALAILDADGGRVPSARFAVKNYWKGGWHPFGYVGVGSAPSAERFDGPFDDVVRDETLHYEVPQTILAVKEPPVPAFTPVPIFTADPNVEIIDPSRYWGLVMQGTRTEMDYTMNGPGGAAAIELLGDLGCDNTLYYFGPYGEKWPAGDYRLTFMVKGHGLRKATVDIANTGGPVTPAAPIPCAEEWKQLEFLFTIPGSSKESSRLRFLLTGEEQCFFAVSGIHLRFANATGAP